MTTIVNIVGARPQFIKYCPVGLAIKRHNRGAGGPIRDILVHTGQHYDYSMSKIFFDDLGMGEPAHHLNVGSGSHGHQTAKVLERVEELLTREDPDAVLVYGDTNSTLGGALAAVKMQIPVVHVESGLRSYNKRMPEEVNRVLTDHLSTVLLCPSERSGGNLAREGFTHFLNEAKLLPLGFFASGEGRHPRATKNQPLVLNTGDIMYDVLRRVLPVAETRSTILEDLRLDPAGYSLLTVHRAENTDVPGKIEAIVDFVDGLPGNRPVVFPMHPRTRKAYEKAGKAFSGRVSVIDPVGYFDMITLLKNSSMVMTDSGGLQKEAFWLRVPCVTLREETEWEETVETGWNVLVRDYRGRHAPQQDTETVYGDGRAAERIVEAITAPGGIFG